MKVDIICPLYNAENYIIDVQKSIEKQNKYVNIENIRYIITKGKDKTEEIVKDIKKKNDKVVYRIIDKKDFSHSLTREREVEESTADIIVFISQDIKIIKEDWLEKLIAPIENMEVDATYSRQVCLDKDSIEFYTRQKNYPLNSKIKTKDDLEELGINTYFYSDVSSAIKRDVFKQLNGYDKKDLPTNEDMYIAYKLINNGYKIKYCSDSEVIHSHNFTFKETFNRYKSYGIFLKQESQLDIKSKQAGSSLAKFIIAEAIKDKNVRVIIKFIPDMLARYIGMKVGKNCK